jgi:drug/metabolite transporter (DMT)-like permease
MIKSSTPVWVLLFSFAFGFEKPKLNLIAVISFIVLGVLLTVDGEPHFNTKGFILVLTAAIASGLRWNMTQFLMKKNNRQQQSNNSPFSTMYHLSPVMFVTMLLLSFYFEKPFQRHQSSPNHIESIQQALEALVVMAIGGILGKH